MKEEGEGVQKNDFENIKQCIIVIKIKKNNF